MNGSTAVVIHGRTSAMAALTLVRVIPITGFFLKKGPGDG
jgi:hypothetical protein